MFTIVAYKRGLVVGAHATRRDTTRNVPRALGTAAILRALTPLRCDTRAATVVHPKGRFAVDFGRSLPSPGGRRWGSGPGSGTRSQWPEQGAGRDSADQLSARLSKGVRSRGQQGRRFHSAPCQRAEMTLDEHGPIRSGGHSTAAIGTMSPSGKLTAEPPTADVGFLLLEL
jgi:hypothetical protein